MPGQADTGQLLDYEDVKADVQKKLSALASSAISEDDPLWQKFLAAPFDPDPAPEQEVLGLEQAQAGGVADGETVSAEIARRAHESRS